MSIYNDNIFNINEGALFLSTQDAKDMKAKIKEICKSYCRKGFKDRFKAAVQGESRSLPDSSTLNSFNEKIKKLFDSCIISNIVLQVRTYSTGYVTVTEEYYCEFIYGFKNNIFICTCFEVNKMDIILYTMSDQNIINTNIISDIKSIMKFLDSLNYNSYVIKYSNNKITVKQVHTRKVNTFENVISYLNNTFSNNYNIKVHKLLGYISLNKK